MRYAAISLILAAALTLSGTCLAQTGGGIHVWEDAVMPDPTVYLPVPHSMDSELIKSDLVWHEWGKSMRDTERGARAKADANSSMDYLCSIFSEPMGITLSKENTPVIYKFLEDCASTTYLKCPVNAKKHFKRTRPYIQFDEGTLVPEKETRVTGKISYSYPSGHTIDGWGAALLLAELYPEASSEIFKVGYEYGISRIIAGYHWHSDVVAGRMVASAEFATLQSSREFQKALKKARKELKQKLAQK